MKLRQLQLYISHRTAAALQNCHCLVAAQDSLGQTMSDGESTWDDALLRSTREFQHRSYNLFTCNCHSFVVNNLNRLSYGGHDNWNVVSLAAWVFLKGTWVNKKASVRSFLPFIVVLCIGILLAGLKFLIGLLLFSVALISWFLLGTYCFRNLIQL
uniref:Protein RTE1-HOMOLOG n=1 Tax=Anthurium amnicola TaxID=1678845 RepID=A0A1D1XPR9_9ARAE